MPRAGKLYIVGTPIGNLGDITLRAVETLREVDLVVAEDTRRTRALLSHLEIRGKPLKSLDAHAGELALLAVVGRLQEGSDVAYVTDAGMPAVSDPGSSLVRLAAKKGVDVVAIPGASAVTAAVALSGLVEGPFLFLGFLPRRGRKRSDAIERIAAAADPVVLFEAPVRLAATLRDLARAIPSRRATVSREITKMHEETVRGTLEALAAEDREWRGEITLVIGPDRDAAVKQVTDSTLDERIDQLLRSGDSAKEVSSHLAAWSGRPRREVYSRVLAIKKRHKNTLPGP